MTINDAIDRIKMYFNLELRDNDKRKLEEIIKNVKTIVVVEEKVVNKFVPHSKPMNAPTLKTIAENVAERCGIKCNDLLIRRRHAWLVRARSEFIEIARNNYRYTTTEIAEFLKVDHSTIIYHANHNYQTKKINRYIKQKTANQ